MSDEPNGLNGLDKRINDRGFFERILSERDKKDAERDRRFDERFVAQDTRLDERFAGQERALQFALTEREKAVNAALAAADQKADKAEQAITQTTSALSLRLDEVRGTRREGMGGLADVGGKVLAVAISLVALIAAVYLGSRSSPTPPVIVTIPTVTVTTPTP